MGLFKILGFAALGVGAVAAAPFTGGGSLLGLKSRNFIPRRINSGP